MTFLSTPSARRATVIFSRTELYHAISIHALREEGDLRGFFSRRGLEISIHALREEGDMLIWAYSVVAKYFYPRPPRGGRHTSCSVMLSSTTFLSTPSARRATRPQQFSAAVIQNFYPRPPRGGRPLSSAFSRCSLVFLSTPSARRATLARNGVFHADSRFLSTPSARRATLDEVTDNGKV